MAEDQPTAAEWRELGAELARAASLLDEVKPSDPPAAEKVKLSQTALT